MLSTPHKTSGGDEAWSRTCTTSRTHNTASHCHEWPSCDKSDPISSETLSHTADKESYLPFWGRQLVQPVTGMLPQMPLNTDYGSHDLLPTYNHSHYLPYHENLKVTKNLVWNNVKLEPENDHFSRICFSIYMQNMFTQKNFASLEVLGHTAIRLR